MNLIDKARKMKNKTLVMEEMKDALMRTYREVRNSHPYCRAQYKIYELAVKQPAPRFYVEPRWAYKRIAGMLSGDRSEIEHLLPLRKEMYEALFETFVRLSARREFNGKSISHILRYAVLEPAPRFYISATRMDQIWKERAKKVVRRKRSGA